MAQRGDHVVAKTKQAQSPHACKRVTIWKYCIYLSPKSKSKDLIFLDKGGEEEQ